MALKSLIPSLLVDNIDESVQYYTNALGFEAVTKYPFWAHLRSSGADIYLTLRESVYSFLPEMKDRQLGGTLTLYIEVEGIEQYYDWVKEKASITMSLHTTGYGRKEFQVKDINGYILDFGEPTQIE